MPAPNRSATGGGVTALSVGPDAAYLLSEAPNLFDRLHGAVPSDMGTITDLSHARVHLALTGPRAGWILSKGIRCDLSDAAMPIGTSIQTQFDSIAVTLHRTGSDAWNILAYRSLGRSIFDMLISAGQADSPA